MRILTPRLMRPSGKRFAMLIAGETIYANEEHATYTAAFIEPMECLPVARVPTFPRTSATAYATSLKT